MWLNANNNETTLERLLSGDFHFANEKKDYQIAVLNVNNVSKIKKKKKL